MRHPALPNPPLDGFTLPHLSRRALILVAIEVERSSRQRPHYQRHLAAKLHDRALELRKLAETSHG